MKYSKEQIKQIRIEIKNKNIDRFPKGFHDDISNHKNLIEIFIDEECNNDITQFFKKPTAELKNGGLGGLLYHYGGSRSNMVSQVLKDIELRPWEQGHVPNNFWQGEVGIKNAHEALTWYFKKYLNEDYESIYSLSYSVFSKVGLQGMMYIKYKNSIYHAFMELFPEKLQPWKFKKHPTNFWISAEGTQVAKQGFQFMLEDKFGKFNKFVDIKDKIATLKEKDFKKYELYKILKYYNHSHHQFIKAITDLEIKDYEWDKSSQGTWKNSFLNCIIVLKEYIENNNLNDDNILLNLSKKDFPNALKNMINIQFGGSPSKAIMALYPMRFAEWQFSKAPQNYWKSPEGKNKAIELTRDLIQNKLNYWSYDEIKNVSTLDFYKYKLSSIITKVYNGKLYDAIMAAYPGTFTINDFDKKGKEEAKFIDFILTLFPNHKYDIRKRYPWLRKSNNYMLELDIFFPEMKLAFEYQGLQHSVDKSEHFGKNYNYQITRNNDQIKKDLCSKKGVTLIEIQYGMELTIDKISELLKLHNRYDILEIINK